MAVSDTQARAAMAIRPVRYFSIASMASDMPRPGLRGRTLLVASVGTEAEAVSACLLQYR